MATNRSNQLPTNRLLWEPEVIIIYVPGTGQTHGVCARRVEGKWRYSAWVIRPESELNPLLAECLEAGMTVIDERLRANLVKRGMGKATPILVVEKGVKATDATEAMALLHRAILKS